MSTLIFGVSVMLVGMLIVFFGLLILIGILTVFNKSINRAPKPAAAPAVVGEAPVVEEETDGTDDGELAAVIAAAVAAVWQQEGNSTGFVVRRVKRIPARF